MKIPQIKNAFLAALILLISIACFSSDAKAQTAPGNTGTLRGGVATAAPDGQSYNVPGASLKLKSDARSLDAVTDDTGEYKFEGLLPGAYTLEVTVQVSRLRARRSLFVPARPSSKTSVWKSRR